MNLDGLLKFTTRVNAVTELQQLNRGGNRLSRQASEEVPSAPTETEVPQTLPRHDRFKSLLQQGSTNTHRQIERLAGHFTKLTETNRSLPSMGNVWWSLKLWTQGLGVAGVIGLGLCAFAIMFYFFCRDGPRRRTGPGSGRA